jgi:hypothetical protein
MAASSQKPSEEGDQMVRGLRLPALVIAGFLILGWNVPAQSASAAAKPPPIDRVLVLDGSPVHDVGNLLLHTGNWGAFGSAPGAAYPFSGAPSAEYPAGSGVEYLFLGGLWVGALKDGIPCVSTATYQMEFRPTSDPIDVVYYAVEGDPGGARLPAVNADDDGDGTIDEEWLDGRDNDGDGLVDEDFAAISDQMLSCWYTDDQPEAINAYPEHNPMHLKVLQRSMQWADPDFDDFVGFEYFITNTGADVLEDVYLGIFIDGDVGSRTTPNYWEDDATGFHEASVQCTQRGPALVEYAYWYDADGDQGQTTGQCGLVLLDCLTDPTSSVAPAEVRFSGYCHFSGNQSFEEGGDPTNDFERYQLLSSQSIERDGPGPQDYRVLVSVGPFAELLPGETLPFVVALFAGDAAGGDNTQVLQHAAAAKLAYEGRWHDLDGDPLTGIAGRETHVSGYGAVGVDTCASPPVIVYPAPYEVVWANFDCAREEEFRLWCGYGDADSLAYRTGVGGKEGQVHWYLPPLVPTPTMVTSIGVRSAGPSAVVSWDLYSDEAIRGLRLQRDAQGGPRVTLPGGGGMLAPSARSYVDDSCEPGREYTYTLMVVMTDGSEISSRTVTTAIPALATSLDQNYPNPFNPSTTISFTLAERSRVNVSVFTLEGKKVVTLMDEVLPAGPNIVHWNGRNSGGAFLSSGIYVCRLEAGKTVLSRKMVYLK